MIRFLPILLALAIFSGCPSDGGVNRGEETTTFRDPGSRFQFVLPRNLIVEKADSGPIQTFEFIEKNDQGETLSVIRLSVDAETPKGKDKDKKKEPPRKRPNIFDQAYEDKFRETCRCSVIKMGIVLFAGAQAREFSLTFDMKGEWTGFQRHFERAGSIYVLEASGPSARAARVRALYDGAVSTFQFLEKADGPS